jgi:NAD-dependent dihydropyrimidine dehydrogenase PreA subunit
MKLVTNVYKEEIRMAYKITDECIACGSCTDCGACAEQCPVEAIVQA